MQRLIRHSERFWYMTPVEETDRPILGAVVGETYTLMIDAGNSEAHARFFIEELERQGVSSPSFLALTHWHWDHIFGLSALPNVLSISSEATKREMENLLPYTWDDDALTERVQAGIEIEFCAAAIRKEYGADRSIRITLPTLTFNESVTIELGGVRAVLKHVGGDHAADAVVVYIPEEKILFLGDALYANLYASSWRMTATETLRLLDAIDEFDANDYVWSHGEVVHRAAYEKDRDALRKIAEITMDFPGNKERITTEYERLVNRKTDEEEQELITFFVNGSEGSR